MAYSTAANADALTTWLNKNFISDLMFECQYQPFTEKAIIPPGAGNVGRYLSWNLPAAGTILTEGTPSEGEVTFTGTKTDITVSEWGQHVKTNELMMYAAVKGAREKLRKRLRDGAVLTVDTAIRAQAAAATTGTGVYATLTAAGASTTAATPAVGNAAALVFAKRLLKDAKAMPFEGVAGHPNKQFSAIISEKFEQDMVQEVSTGKITWFDMVKNVPGVMGQEKAINGYLGSVYGVAVYTTQNNAQITLTSLSDVNVVLADGGLGSMAFEDMDPGILVTPVNGPYRNQDWIAWHLMFNTAAIAGAGVRVIRLYTNAA